MRQGKRGAAQPERLLLSLRGSLVLGSLRPGVRATGRIHQSPPSAYSAACTRRARLHVWVLTLNTRPLYHGVGFFWFHRSQNGMRRQRLGCSIARRPRYLNVMASHSAAGVSPRSSNVAQLHPCVLARERALRATRLARTILPDPSASYSPPKG